MKYKRSLHETGIIFSIFGVLISLFVLIDVSFNLKEYIDDENTIASILLLVLGNFFLIVDNHNKRKKLDLEE